MNLVSNEAELKTLMKVACCPLRHHLPSNDGVTAIARPLITLQIVPPQALEPFL